MNGAQAPEETPSAVGRPSISKPSLQVTVCVLTYRRPDDLAALLPVVLTQVANSSESVELLVVDNDPDGGAEGQVAQYQSDGVRYAHEPVPGIAAARNRALDEAASSDVVVFLDDDERPADGWLDALVSTYRRAGVAGVVGPVVSTFETELDPWLVAGHFFERRQWTTGTFVRVAATNNLLLDLSVVQRIGLRFDERFGLTGGSDTLFTSQLTRSGGRLVWCQEALVHDVVPASRRTRSWALRRTYRIGNGTGVVRVVLAATPLRRAVVRTRLVTLGLGRLAVGAVQGLLGLSTGSMEHRARGARLCARGAGLVTGALGSVYAEYAREPVRDQRPARGRGRDRRLRRQQGAGPRGAAPPSPGRW